MAGPWAGDGPDGCGPTARCLFQEPGGGSSFVRRRTRLFISGSAPPSRDVEVEYEQARTRSKRFHSSRWPERASGYFALTRKIRDRYPTGTRQWLKEAQALQPHISPGRSADARGGQPRPSPRPGGRGKEAGLLPGARPPPSARWRNLRACVASDETKVRGRAHGSMCTFQAPHWWWRTVGLAALRPFPGGQDPHE